MRERASANGRRTGWERRGLLTVGDPSLVFRHRVGIKPVRRDERDEEFEELAPIAEWSGVCAVVLAAGIVREVPEAVDAP